jgi:hypothetical protein
MTMARSAPGSPTRSACWISSTTPSRPARKPSARTRRFKAGDWCREGFCPLRANCKHHDDWALSLAQAQFEDHSGAIILPSPFDMTPTQMAERLEWVEAVQGWCKIVLAHAHEQAEQGRQIPGWKLVNKRQYRRWKDPEIADTLMDFFGLEEDQVYEPRELKTPAKLEPLMPGKNKAIRAEKLKPYLAEPSPTGTVLAREQDKRPAANRSAAGQFENLLEAIAKEDHSNVD